MKKYLLILALAFVGCNCFCDNSHNSVIDKEIVIGNTYKLCTPAYFSKADPNDPFDEDINEPASYATVIVEEKKNGYVKYCWNYSYGKPNHVSFSRSYKEFMSLMNGCK